MTREEAIKTLKENYCAICAYGSQDMDYCDIRSCDNKDAINTLEQEPFINKPCVSIEACKYDKNKVLDRLSDEIKDTLYVDSAIFTALYDFKNGKIDVDDVIDKFNHETRTDVLKIIEEFKKESEDSSSITLKTAINSIYGIASAQHKLTNGDVMKSLFPDIEIETVKDNDKILGYDISKLDNETYFTKGWWDAPYRIESEGENE